MRFNQFIGFGVMGLFISGILGQQALRSQADSVEEPSLTENKGSTAKKKISATWKTQTEARTMRLTIPAPRGQIVDRNGVALAHNRVAKYLALNFPFIANAKSEQILSYAKEKMGLANQVLGKNWVLSDEKLLEHYQHRRWLPLIFSYKSDLKEEITPEQEKLLEPLFSQGLLLQPVYQRYYPLHEVGCHMIGYTGKTRPLPTGPIEDGDLLFEDLQGKSGLEFTYEATLRGKSGLINLLFDADGKLMHDEMLVRPVPGANVVTTLDVNLQRYAENALAKHARSGGAMVIMDIRSGEILTMASNPNFDLNLFIPGISPENYKALTESKQQPMYARTFLGTYPPASTFKIVTALGALDSGKIQDNTLFDCCAALEIGNRVFHNHTKNGEGEMNVVNAIKRSCNTWFYQAAMRAGGEPIMSMARNLGFGEKTGILLEGESSGYLPTGRKIVGGELANISIGQGQVLATPLQVCQSMAAVADGEYLIQPQLVRQIQAFDDKIIKTFPKNVKRRLSLNREYRDAVVKGMVAVVSGGGGTGHAAAIKQAQIAGKTGTAQWRIGKDQNLAWFTGFLPANNPILAFAVVYEGAPGEDVSGGRKAAPIVKEVFSKFYEKASPEDPLVAAMKDLPVAIALEDETTVESIDVVAQPQETKPELPKKTLGGFFKKLFKRE
jgi:penicillin-binding protein 2